jgi:hypothetical protein
MPAVPWWAVLSAVALPVLLIIGWTTAALREPSGYDPLADTVSALSSYGMTDMVILMGCLAGLGLAHLITAIGLRPVRRIGRLVYGIGGAATILVAAVPKVDSHTPRVHGIAAVVGFVGLAAWPAAAVLPDLRHAFRARNRARPAAPDPATPSPDRPWVLRPTVGIVVTLTMLALGLWLALQLPDGGLAGLAERMTAGAEVIWPLIVVLTLFRRTRRHPPAPT